ncbi:MAG: LysR family transcriptional regulator [Firmicutes bacterium]|nr:LysR family transcriptional regulator [Bacillota bacterium]
MIPYDYFSIDMMQIEVFLKCAEYKSFTKSAESLKINTSMVSKRISALETILDTKLFIRNKNRVYLSAAGELLYQRLSNPVNSIVSALNDIRRYNRNDVRPLTFGLSNYTNVSRYLIPLLNAFEIENDQFSFKFKAVDYFDQTDALLSGQIDIFFVPKFMESKISRNPLLKLFKLDSSPLYACFNINSSFVQTPSIHLSDLKDMKFLFPQGTADADEYTHWINQICSREGYIPSKGGYFSDMVSVLLNIHEDEVYLTDRYFHDFQANYVIFREVLGTDSGLIMVFRKECSASTLQFAQYARDFYSEYSKV